MVERGTTALLDCKASGNPTVNIYWMKNALRLTPNSRFSVVQGGNNHCEFMMKDLLDKLRIFHYFQANCKSMMLKKVIKANTNVWLRMMLVVNTHIQHNYMSEVRLVMLKFLTF